MNRSWAAYRRAVVTLAFLWMSVNVPVDIMEHTPWWAVLTLALLTVLLEAAMFDAWVGLPRRSASVTRL